VTKLPIAIEIADNTKYFMPLINITRVPNEEVDSHTLQ
jgi:hypothetical protein